MDKAFDFSTAKKVWQTPALQKLRKAHQASQQNDLLDNDVIEHIRQAQVTDNQQKDKTNGVLRRFW